MPFIHVVGCDFQPQGFEHLHTTDPQHNFLVDTHIDVATIQLICDVVVVNIIGFNVGVHQIQGYCSHLYAPNSGIYLASWIIYLNSQFRTIGIALQVQGHIVEIVEQIAFLLPTIGIEILSKVALLI